VIVAGLALPDTTRLYKADVSRPAARASYTVRPTTRDKVLKTVVRIGKIQDCFLKGLRFARHELGMSKLLDVSSQSSPDLEPYILKADEVRSCNRVGRYASCDPSALRPAPLRRHRAHT
jgi:hypothetical protein